jgi:hypothetical protein
MVQLVKYGYIIKDDLKNPSDACGNITHHWAIRCNLIVYLKMVREHLHTTHSITTARYMLT